MQYFRLTKFKFVVEPRYYFYGWSKSPVVKGRMSAVRALTKARTLLPKGYNFKIWDCHRTRGIQMLMVHSFYKRLRLMHPKAAAAKIKKLAKLYGGSMPPPIRVKRLDTHRNGGAFDITIVDKVGRELYMGTDHDDLTLRAATNYYERKKKLNILEREAKKNRRLLIRTMTKAGFKNYDPEWWHWGYDE